MVAPTQPQATGAIDAVLARARGRWVLARVLRAGGRYGLGIGALAAATGAALIAARLPTAAAFISLVGVAFIGAALAVAWRAASRTGDATPPFALALDRALGTRDALPTWLEGAGPFAGLLETRIAAALEPGRVREAMPRPRPWALAAALLLCLLPLGALLVPPPEEPADPTVARGDTPQDAPQTPEQPAGAQEPEPVETPPSGGSGGQPEPQPQQPGSDPQERPPEGAGEAPPDMPQPDVEPPPRSPQDVGDETGPPPPKQPKPPSAEPDVADLRLLPEVGEGETRTENRARWVYNPEGAAHEGANPRAPENRAVAERAVQRQKVTTGERRLIENLFEKLYK